MKSRAWAKAAIEKQSGRAALKSALLCSLALMVQSCAASERPARYLDPRDFGAKADGKAEDTRAIQQTIDECTRQGGGTVRLSSGRYLSGPITLKNNCTLQLDKGATLVATDDRAHFLKPDAAEPPSTGDFVPFIGAKGATNISITGSGTIDGSGARWWGPAMQAKLTNKTNSGYTLPRPRLILLSRCSNVRIYGVTLANSPCFHLVPEECENVTIENVTITAPDEGVNTDGIDPSRSRNVRISKCRIDVGDDNVAIKAGRPVEGREFASEDIVVSDCLFQRGHGMSIGSETLGGVRNVRVERCRFDGTENGLRIKSPRGKGGRVENILYSDITMTNVSPAIVFTCYYPKIPSEDAAKPSAVGTPIFRNIVVSNMVAHSTKEAGIIIGLPESPAIDVQLINVSIDAKGEGLTIRNAKQVRTENLTVRPAKGEPLIINDAEVQKSSK